MFDSIIAAANERFNLNKKAETLLTALLSLMTDGTRGGFPGFLDRFNRAGLENAVSSWTRSGANIEISSERLETVVEKDRLQDFADQIGNDYATTTSAVAFMIPRVVDLLTPDGVVPQDDNLLSKIGGALNGEVSSNVNDSVAETFDRIGTSAGEKTPAPENKSAQANVIDRNVSEIAGEIDSSLEVSRSGASINESPLAWILPLCLLGLLLALGYWFCSKSPESAAPNAANINAGNVSVDANANVANQ